jgi:hypothetical protein
MLHRLITGLRHSGPGRPARLIRLAAPVGLLAGAFLAGGSTAKSIRVTVDEDFNRGEAARVATLDRAEFLPSLDPPWGVQGGDSVALGDGSTLFFGGGASMNRVDGFSILGTQGVENQLWLPGIRMYEAYGFSSHRWSGALESAIHPGTPLVSVGVRWFDETAAWPLPIQAVRSDENFAAALFLRDDYMDYLHRRGTGVFVALGHRPGRGLQVLYSDEQDESLHRARARIGPFGGDKRFSPNPLVDEGRWHVLRARGIWAISAGSRTWEDKDTHVFLVDAQASGGSLGGERKFLRLWAEQRGRQRLTPFQFIGYRLAGGWTPQGNPEGRSASRLPPQWQFQAGGIGSLRAHDFQEFRGDRVTLMTVEYGVIIKEKVRPVLFVDGGKAWNQEERLSGGIGGSGPMALDGGVGLQLGSGMTSARLDVARDLRVKRGPAWVSLRLSVPF